MGIRQRGVEQAYPLINALYKQSTGQDALTVTSPAQFMSVAEELKELPFNQVATGVSEMYAGLIVTDRPYSARLRLPWVSTEEYGNHIIKITFIDGAVDAQQSPGWELKDGQSLGQHKVKLPKIWETQYWGKDTIQASITIIQEQLYTAFSGPDQFAKYMTGLSTSIRNQLEQQREQAGIACMLNYAGGKLYYAGQKKAGHVRYMISEYNTKYTKTYKTLAELRAVAADYQQFIRFVFAELNGQLRDMADRSEMYHINPTAGKIMRHTPAADVKAVINAKYLDEIDTQVLSGVWNLPYMKEIQHEEVNYWQNKQSPYSIKVKPAVMNDDGTIKEATEQNASEVFALIWDREALGCGITDEYTGDTWPDPEKRAMNRYWQLDFRMWNDFTENGTLILFEVEPAAGP